MRPKSSAEQVFRIATELAEKVVVQTESLRVATEEDLMYRRAILFFFAKAYKTYLAIQVLWGRGFAEDCFMLSRTIFEIALQVRYMMEDPGTRAQLFARSDPVMRDRFHEKLQQTGDADLLQKIESRAQELEELKACGRQFGKDYPHPHNWWGKSVAWLAKHLGTEMHRRYLAIYSMQSDFVHSGVTSARKYLAEDQRKLKLDCYPSPSDDVGIPQEVTLYFLQVTAHVSEALGLGLDAEVSRAMQAFQEATSADAGTE